MAQSQSFPSSFHDPVDPDHHLWRNGHRWWIAFTVHLPGWQKERVRFSLGTADLSEARARRDRVLREYPQTRGCELSLRLDGRRGQGGSGGAAEPPQLDSERGFIPRERGRRGASPSSTSDRGIHSRGSEGHAA